MDIFEQALREKLRFTVPGVSGLLTTEQVNDLPLTSKSGASLDGLAVALDTDLRNAAPKSFINGGATAANKTQQLRFDIVKSLIDSRLADRDAKVAAAEKASEREKLLQMKANRQDAALEQLTDAEIDKRLAALG